MTAVQPTQVRDEQEFERQPEDYKAAVRKIVQSHAVNELYGAQVFDEPAIALAPTPYAKWLTCRVAMEEYGHHVRFRELGEKIGIPREEMTPDRKKPLSIFDFPMKTWAEFCVIKLLADFGHCVGTLWRDKLGQISLAVTTLFWGAGATLQFIILKWCEQVLGMTLSQGAIMQAVVAIGIAIGSVWAAARVSLKRSLSVLPVGVAMGLLVSAMAFVDFGALPAGGLALGALKISWGALLASALMIVVGALAGYFVVPMNALLQHRGYVLLSAGHSIAVQNFNENLSILVMLSVYAALIWANLAITTIIVLFGLFVAGTMFAVILRHRYNQRQFDSESLIGQPRRA